MSSSRQAQGAEQTADNTWIVHIEGEAGVGDDDYSYPVSDNWVEPPLFSVGSGALEWDIAYSEFEQDGTDYLVFGKPIDDFESAVTAVDLTYLPGQGLVAAAAAHARCHRHGARHRRGRLVRVRTSARPDPRRQRPAA